MWSCGACSYAYNRAWINRCDVCAARRRAPSLTRPALTTLAPRYPSIKIRNFAFT